MKVMGNDPGGNGRGGDEEMITVKVVEVNHWCRLQMTESTYSQEYTADEAQLFPYNTTWEVEEKLTLDRQQP